MWHIPHCSLVFIFPLCVESVPGATVERIPSETHTCARHMRAPCMCTTWHCLNTPLILVTVVLLCHLGFIFQSCFLYHLKSLHVLFCCYIIYKYTYLIWKPKAGIVLFLTPSIFPGPSVSPECRLLVSVFSLSSGSQRYCKLHTL